MTTMYVPDGDAEREYDVPEEWVDRILALDRFLRHGPTFSLRALEHLHAMQTAIDDGYTGAAYDRLLAAEKAAAARLDWPELR